MDLPNTKELAKFVAFLRKSGVTRFKSGDFELELSPTALFPESAYKKNKNNSDEAVVTESPYSEADALFWSSEGIPEVNQ